MKATPMSAIPTENDQKNDEDGDPNEKFPSCVLPPPGMHACVDVSVSVIIVECSELNCARVLPTQCVARLNT